MHSYLFSLCILSFFSSHASLCMAMYTSRLDVLNTDGPGAMKFGNYRYVEKPLRLGDHLGNQFEIIIRNVRAHDSKLSLHECVGRAADTVQCSGFVNYYGRQRFGLENAVVNAWTIGLAMLREQYVSLTLQFPLDKEAEGDGEGGGGKYVVVWTFMAWVGLSFAQTCFAFQYRLLFILFYMCYYVRTYRWMQLR